MFPKNVFEPFRTHLASKFVKSANMRRQIFDQKFNMGIKTQNLMLILNPFEKLQNIRAKKVIDEKVMGNRSFLF
jgi:hypothetical protein